MSLEFKRILLEELPRYEAEGWAPASEGIAGGVLVDTFAGGTQQAVLVTRPAPVTPEPLGSYLDVTGLAASDLEVVGQLVTWLRAPGDHHRLVRMRTIQVLIAAAELAGDHDAARGLAMQLTEIARAYDRANARPDGR